MKIGAFIVTYRRDDHLATSLEALLRQTRVPDLVLVVDNADSSDTAAVARSFAHPAVVYSPAGANLGSAGGTEVGVRHLWEAGCDLIYFGDDDNPPSTDDTVERLARLAMEGGDDVGGAGALGGPFDWQRGALTRLPDEDIREVMDVDFIGGNHTLTVHRRVVDEVGFPNGELFFGYPDLEYCLRIRRAGYRLLVDGELMRRHREASGRLGIDVPRSARPRRPYSAIWRNYYTTRNYIHMMRVTFARPDLARRAAVKAVLKSLVAWSRGPRYGARFTGLQARAVADGFAGRLGLRVAPQSKYPGGEDR